MRTKATLLLLIVITASLPFFSNTTKAYTAHEVVLVAYDEEFEAHRYLRYVPLGFPILCHAEKYIEWQLSRAWYHWDLYFGDLVDFWIVDIVQWDSDDTYHIDQLLDECMIETGFKNHDREGLKNHERNDLRTPTLLIAFTGQDNDQGCYGGGCYPEEKAMIIRHQEEWADDNVILHELSHIWQLNHCQRCCIMSMASCEVTFYDEPLAPDNGHITLYLGISGLCGYFSYEWCDQCVNTMRTAMQEMYPPPPDPWLEGLGPRGPTFYVWATFWILAITILLVLIGKAIINKARRHT